MLGRDDEREVTRAIRSGWLTHSGKYVAEFERPFFSPLHTLPPFAGYRAVGHLPVTADLAARGLVLPTSSHLTERDVRFIANRLIAALP
jgi:dTDP-4-amino-4,6-dideoxygalactose transaminase